MGRKYNCNYDYFKEIDTEDKSYWLGFLYADGSIHKTKHTMDLVLSINDKEHLYSFVIVKGLLQYEQEFSFSVKSIYPQIGQYLILCL